MDSYFQHVAQPPPRPLTAEQISAAQDLLAAHSNDPDSHQCPHCHVPACLVWRDAYDALAGAGVSFFAPAAA